MKKIFIALVSFIFFYSGCHAADRDDIIDLKGKARSIAELETALDTYKSAPAGSLKRLDLSDNPEHGNEAIRYLVDKHSDLCEAIETIKLTNSGLKAESLPQIQSFINLKHLDISHNPSLTAVVHTVSGAPVAPLIASNLQVLEARDIEKAGGFLYHINTSLPRLETLDLSVSTPDSSEDINDSSLTLGLTALHHLKSLAFAGRHKVGLGRGMYIISGISSLVYLDLSHCNLDDNLILPLYEGTIGGSLADLRLAHNYLTGTSIVSLCFYLQRLQHINLSEQTPRLPELTKNAFSRIFEGKMALEF